MAAIVTRLLICMPFGLLANFIQEEYRGIEGFQIWLCGWVLCVAGSLVVWAAQKGGK